MRIEETDKERLEKASDKELLVLKLRFTQQWDKTFEKNAVAVVGSLNRSSFLKNYRLLLNEMNTRELEHSTSPIDRASFKKSMIVHKFGIDVSGLEDIVVVPNCIIVDPSNVDPEEVTIFIKNQQEDFCHAALSNGLDPTALAEDNYIPLYDLVLKAKQETVIVKVSKTKAKKALKKEEEKFEKFIPIFPIDKASEEHIVCGIVYEPNTVDAQNDKANEVEIRKAAYQFMEEIQLFKVQHKGNKVRIKVLESYLAPVDFTIAKKKIKKGTWLLTVRILDKKIWKAVKDGELTGFSMAGQAESY